MGCKNTKASDSSAADVDLSSEDQAAIRRLSWASEAHNDAGDDGRDITTGNNDTGRSKFGMVARRDSIRINKSAIEKRKKNVAGEGGPVKEGMQRPLPRAFMKPGQKSSAPKGGKFGKIKRRDSIRVNKEKMSRKKKHRLSGSGENLAADIKVEVVPPTPKGGEAIRKSPKQEQASPTTNPSFES